MIAPGGDGGVQDYRTGSELLDLAPEGFRRVATGGGRRGDRNPWMRALFDSIRPGWGDGL